MNEFLHSIRNGKPLTELQLQQIAPLVDEQKLLLIRAYNDSLKSLGEFIQELLSSIGPHLASIPE